MPSPPPPASPRRPATVSWLAPAALIVAIAAWLGAGQRVGGLLISSALVAVPAATLAISIGAWIGVLIAKTDAPGRRLALVMLAALTLLPLHVFTTGWLAAAGEGGWLASLAAGGAPTRGFLSGYSGAIVLHALAAAPLATLLAVAAFRTVDRRQEEQALLDASPRRVLLLVTLRESLPTLIASGLAVAVLIASEIAITDLLRVRTFAEEVYTQAAAGQLTDSLAGGTRLLSAVVALAAVALLAMSRFTVNSAPRASGVEPAWSWSLRGRMPAMASLWVVVAGLSVVPIGSLIYTAGASLVPDGVVVRRVWSPAKTVAAVAAAPWQHRRELRVSLTLATAVATGATVAGGGLAWLMRRDAIAAVVMACVALLLAIPGPLVGVAVIRLLNQPLDSPVAWLGEFYGTWFAPWLAQMIRIVPYTLLLLGPIARALPKSIFEAAETEGAGSVSRVLRLAVPLAGRGLVAAWLVAFALSVGELSATVLVVPPGTPPLTVRLLSLLHYGVEDRVAAISLVLVAGYAAIAATVLWLLPSRRVVG